MSQDIWDAITELKGKIKFILTETAACRQHLIHNKDLSKRVDALENSLTSTIEDFDEEILCLKKLYAAREEEKTLCCKRRREAERKKILRQPFSTNPSEWVTDDYILKSEHERLLQKKQQAIDDNDLIIDNLQKEIKEKRRVIDEQDNELRKKNILINMHENASPHLIVMGESYKIERLEKKLAEAKDTWAAEKTMHCQTLEQLAAANAELAHARYSRDLIAHQLEEAKKEVKATNAALDIRDAREDKPVEYEVTDLSLIYAEADLWGGDSHLIAEHLKQHGKVLLTLKDWVKP